ncbi:MAG TPA: hypothetical protein VIH75_21300 [Candidatus Sulfotelmatobacter sp.]|jgi:hypothetical protein
MRSRAISKAASPSTTLDYVVASFHQCSFACEPQKSTVSTSRIIICKKSTLTSDVHGQCRLFDAGCG